MASHISLRFYGYSSYDNDVTRHNALVKAITVNGRDAVRNRLEHVTQLCSEKNYTYCDNMRNDLAWLDASFGKTLNETTRLSTYGYCTRINVLERQKALQKAIEAVGKNKVIDRLNHVIPLSSSNKRAILENDLLMLTTRNPAGVDTSQMLQDLVAVRDTISKLIEALS